MSPIADVRMIQRCDGARFAIEPFAEIRIRCDVRWENFDGDRAIKARVASFVDFAHTARAERRLDFVRAKPGAY